MCPASRAARSCSRAAELLPASRCPPAAERLASANAAASCIAAAASCDRVRREAIQLGRCVDTVYRGGVNTQTRASRRVRTGGLCCHSGGCNHAIFMRG
eukprot:886701-Prymnesium_polylepis.1